MEIQPLRLTKPFKKATILNITQSFHAGHKALDLFGEYGTPLVAPEDCRIDEEICDCAISNGPEGIERGFGLHLIGLETGNKYTYWHLWPHFPVNAGDLVKRGSIIAFMGNSGNVNVGGHYVPLKDRNNKPYPGTHLHLTVYDKKSKPVDPAPLIDWDTEPQHTNYQLIRAWYSSLSKARKNAFK